MAELRDACPAIEATGVRLAALSVDPPETAAELARSLKLPFPLLCDTGQEWMRVLGIRNPHEFGGLVRPSLTLIDRDRRIVLQTKDSMGLRPTTPEIVRVLREAGAESRRIRPPRTAPVLPGPLTILRALARFTRRVLTGR